MKIKLIFILFFMICLSRPELLKAVNWDRAAEFSSFYHRYIMVPHSASLNITGSFAIELWIKPDAEGLTQSILQKRKGANNNGYSLYLNAGRVAIRTNSATKLIGKTIIQSEKWTHISAVYNSSTDVFYIYLNGVEDTSVVYNSAAPLPNGDSLLIGTGANGEFNGLMDEVRIWSKYLHTTDVVNTMRISLGTNSGWYSGLALSMPFQVTNITTIPSDFSVNDFSGNNNNGIPHSMYSRTMPRPSQTITPNECARLFGTDDYISGPDHPGVSPTAGITMEAWVYPFSFSTSASTLSTVIHKGNASGSTKDYNISIQAKRIDMFINDIRVATVTSAADLFPVNKWTHFAGTYNGSNGFWKIIINGNKIYDDTNNVGLIRNGPDSIYFGGTSSTSPKHFEGYLDEVRITNADVPYEDLAGKTFATITGSNDYDYSTMVNYGLDGGLISTSSDGPRLYLRGGTQFSKSSYGVNVPVSPVIFDGQVCSHETGMNNFFYTRSLMTRIPAIGTSGNMISDTLDIPVDSAVW
ncbi:MAG: LamG domain-containing protein, partial [Ignavibacteria bacterium]